MKTKPIITVMLSILVFGALGTIIIYRSKNPKVQTLLGVVSPKGENR